MAVKRDAMITQLRLCFMHIRVDNTLAAVRLRAQQAVSTPKKSRRQPVARQYGRLVLCRRLFRQREVAPADPAELQLVYAQAQHHVVQTDEYTVSEGLSLQLAGLQAHVTHGPYQPNKHSRYDDVTEYLPQRLSHARAVEDVAADIAREHKRVNMSTTTQEAKRLYLSLVSHTELYGATKVFCHYRGYLPQVTENYVSVSTEGIRVVPAVTQTVLFNFKFSTDIQEISLDLRRNMFVIALRPFATAPQRSFLYECRDLKDFTELIRYYCPNLATWTPDLQTTWQRKVKVSEGDWMKVTEDIESCRKALVLSNLAKIPQTAEVGLLKNAFKRYRMWFGRMSGRGGDPDQGDVDVDATCSHWYFTKSPCKTALTNLHHSQLEDVASRMFNSSLIYAGLESVAVLEEYDLAQVVQTMMGKCLENPDICNEFYLQLIKQTTDPVPEISRKGALRYWHLLCQLCCLLLPPHRLVLNYIKLHLRRYSQMRAQQEGRYAEYALNMLHRTDKTGPRLHPPSQTEIIAVSRTATFDLSLYLPDGHEIKIDIDSQTTALEVVTHVQARLGMRRDVEGYALYETCPNEPYVVLKPTARIADSFYRHERRSRSKDVDITDLKFYFKKWLFMEPFANPADPSEVEAVYHQAVTEVFEQRVPITREDATQLCALRAQREYSDHHDDTADNNDYSSVMRILPRHLRQLMSEASIAQGHRALRGMTTRQTNLAFLDVLRHWPLFGSAIYEVTQTMSSLLPEQHWLAVSHVGLHLLDKGGEKIYSNIQYKDIFDVIATSSTFQVAIKSPQNRSTSLEFTTKQAYQIQYLMKAYEEETDKRKLAIANKLEKNSKDKMRLQDELSKHSSSDGITYRRAQSVQ